jgi:hypothetical protein
MISLPPESSYVGILAGMFILVLKIIVWLSFRMAFDEKLLVWRNKNAAIRLVDAYLTKSFFLPLGILITLIQIWKIVTTRSFPLEWNHVLYLSVLLIGCCI